MWRKSNLCQKWLWAPCLVCVELTLLVPRARPAIGPGESAVKPKAEITKSCFRCQWCGSSKSWLGQHPREDMSAPDSPAHLHALLQLGGRAAAWPAAAAAASGRAVGRCRSVGCSEAAVCARPLNCSLWRQSCGFMSLCLQFHSVNCPQIRWITAVLAP